eukprot:TRINITY_DN2488_c0_g4_i1.p1 TRINITY_DN2488_c0_g4~~TRINITY_DN2488_c0_g4_i1.p1  ORF type:complete len:290 (-),score=44.70 TRINITY_DN2488_c0_g4_i1:481-1350(-)
MISEIAEKFKSKYTSSQLEFFVNFSCGAFAGLITDLVTFPVDTIRARQQVAATFRTHSHFSLLRGIGVVTVITIPEHALYFLLYDFFVRHVFEKDKPRSQKSSTTFFLSGLTAELVDIVLFNPIDVIKQKLQVSPPHLNLRWHQTFSSVADLWKGVIPNVLCHGPFLGIHWALYEPFKYFFSPDPNVLPSPFVIIGSSMAASAFAAAVTNPLDIIRTRVQTSHGHVTSRGVIKNMIEKEGLKSLRLGLYSRILYLSPATALLICIYEFSKGFCMRHLGLKAEYNDDDLF